MGNGCDSWDTLHGSLQQAIEAGDVESLRVWYDSVPAIREASRRLPDFVMKWPVLEGEIKKAFEDIEPAPVKAARVELDEFVQAASEYESEAGTVSFTSWPMDENGRRGFLEDRPPAMFGQG